MENLLYTNVQVLEHYSKRFPWVSKTLYCQIGFRKTNQSNVWHSRRILESRTMKVFVSWQLWRCVCTEMRDLRKKLLIYSTYCSRKLNELILQTTLRCLFGRYCNSGKYCSGRFSPVIYLQCRSIYDWGACLWGGVSGNSRKLYGYYFIIATFAISLISLKVSSKPIAIHRVIISLIKLVNWRDIWSLVKNYWNLFFRKTCINCEKH